MAKNDKQDFSNPLIAGREYLRLKDEKGTSVPDIARQFSVSIPAVYKYIQLAECDKRVQNYIENGDITATKVISILHQNDKGDVLAAVSQAVKIRRVETKRLEKEGITKITVKRRLKELTREIDSKKLTSPKAQFLKEIANKLIQGESVAELLTLTAA